MLMLLLMMMMMMMMIMVWKINVAGATDDDAHHCVNGGVQGEKSLGRRKFLFLMIPFL